MDRRKKIIYVLLISLSLSLVVNIPLMDALEVETHELINEMISFGNFNNFSLNTYLIDHLGINEGINKLFDGNAVSRWIRKGGRYEDIPWNPPFDFTPPYLRSVNHFHNPLTDKGVSGFAFGVLLSGDSSVKWAQKPLHTQSPGGHYSWYDARDYFYKALITRDNTFREKFFAETFRALGQLMHLVQDASAPEHTRDDSHVTGYEKWVKANANINAIPPFRVDKSILNRPTSDHPIANLFDTNQYDGTSPDGTAGSNMGLTEYSNANFFTDDTINSKKFRYPGTDSTTIVERPYVTKFGDPYTRQYYLKNCCGETNGGLGYLLSAVDCLDYWRKRDPRLSNMAKIPILDESVYSDYASLLLPRAVVYSAGLLEYFFRGNLHVDLLVPSVDQATYDISDRNDTGRNIDKIALFFQNNSKLNGVIEPIGPGTLALTVSYKNTQTGETILLPAGTGSITEIPQIGSEYVMTLLFSLSEPIPTQIAEETTYFLVYRGQLGKETDAVIGKVITAPVLYSVTPDQGTEKDIVTIAGKDLPKIAWPYTAASENIKFSHDVTMPYKVEVISKTETEMTVRVPDTAGLMKPGYGGLRLRKVVGEGEEKESIYSNPVSFFPIAEGVITNSTDTLQNVTMKALNPISGDYTQLPRTIIYPIPPKDSVWIKLMTGFTYEASGGPGTLGAVQDIYILTPNEIDFEFNISPEH